MLKRNLRYRDQNLINVILRMLPVHPGPGMLVIACVRSIQTVNLKCAVALTASQDLGTDRAERHSF